ncbi:MAG: DUF4159 domain-containing protein [Chthoniobacteraceae bacterium]
MNALNDSPDTPEADSFGAMITRWINRARYMTVSALLHIILVLILGGTVLYKQISEPPDFAAPPGGLLGDEAEVPRQQENVEIQKADFSPNSPSTTSSAPASQIATITTNSTSANSFTMAPITNPTLGVKLEKPSAAPVNVPSVGAKGLSKGQASRIAGFTGGWAKGGTASMSQPLKSRAFEFTAYLAKYAGGDWDSTVWLEADKSVRGGSLHNLLFIISRLSHKKIHANPQPVPLDLASNEIFEKKPPFIWFTGHRDFHLTDQEVKNLGEYLRSGGCIWGDSSLPGNRSRFDIAFRREMLRILPELNQQWAPLPASHPIYTNTYYQEIKGVVPGINYYKEPIYGLKGFADEVAVIYTANDYGDMWQFGLDENGDFDMSRDEKRRFVAINEQMWHRKNLYFRNVEPKALMDTYKFGTNIIIHLLTRWEAHVRFAPRVSSNP